MTTLMIKNLFASKYKFILLFLLLFAYANRLEAFGLIKKFCIASIEAQIALTGTEPPEGMKEFTCQCFLDKVNEGYSISSAQSFCREGAIDKFKL